MYTENQKEIIRELCKYDFIGGGERFVTFGQFLSDVLFANPIKFPNNLESEIHILSSPNEFNSVFAKEGCGVYAVFYVVQISNLLHKLIKDELITTIASDSCETYSYIGNINQFYAKDAPEGSNKIYILPEDDYLSEDGWHSLDGTLKYCCTKIMEKQKPIQDLINICPFITPDLRKLVKDDFKTIADKTLKWTRVAAIVSFIGVLAAISLPFLAPTKNESMLYVRNLSVVDEQKNDEMATISTSTFKELSKENTATD